MLGKFNPSPVVDEIYAMLDDYETHGTGLYDHGAVDAIIDYLENYAKVEWVCACEPYPNEEGGVCSFAIVDCGHPQLVMFDYKY